MRGLKRMAKYHSYKLYRPNLIILFECIRIEKKLKKKFETTRYEEKYNGLTSLFHYPLLLETEEYYNKTLVCSYAIFKSYYNKHTSYALTAYHFENLVFRIISFWEYLYHFLNHYLELELYDYKAREKFINNCYHTPKLIKENGINKLIFEPKSIDEQKKIKKELKKKLKYINKQNILSEIKSNYEVKGNFEKLLDLIENNKITELKDIRNQIIHQRPASAKWSIEFSDLFNGYSIGSNNNGWVNFKENLHTIEFCMNKAAEAIQYIHDIVCNNEYPNTIKNSGKEFYLKTVECNNCKKCFNLPEEAIGENNKFIEVIICPYCKEMGCKVIQRGKTTEVHSNSTLGAYLDMLNKND